MIKYTTDEIDSLLKFQHKRILTSLFTRFLTLVENLEDEHHDLLEKLYNALPPGDREKVALADYWTETRAEQIRKAILDDGNDAIRALDEMLVFYEIKMKGSR